MGESRTPTDPQCDEIIAAFDRERNRMHEWSRRYAEQMRELRTQDRPVYIERRRQPRR